MVYYGAVSKGCERCRQRKIKCDSRKPGCLKCEKYGLQCPGYRDLADVLFRDERTRIVRKAVHKEHDPLSSYSISSRWPPIPNSSRPALRIIQSVAPCTNNVCHPLAYDPHELGVNFFLRKYSLERPSAIQSLGMLKASHLEDPRKDILRTVIEAVGLAGLSNIHFAPQCAMESRKQYSKTLLHLQRNLSNPTLAVSDITLMTIYLLVLFEMINFDNWKQHQSWATHVGGISSLLALRGKEQFDRDRGVQIYLQVRSQIVAACLRQQEPIPPSLVQTCYLFHTSSARDRWREQNLATSGSICEIAFRVVNLRAALRKGEIVDVAHIYEKCVEIERDLEGWKVGIHPQWRYETIHELGSENPYSNKRHIYSTVWVAEAWNGWRGMRILTNQIMIRNAASEVESKMGSISDPKQIIREMSEGIVTSIPSFKDSPRSLSLIEPLYCVAQEVLNDTDIRRYAIEQLRCINSSMGVRQAALFADSATEQLNDRIGTSISKSD